MVMKYQLGASVLRDKTFAMPVVSTFLTLQLQNGLPTMWWLCSEEGPYVKRTFVTLPTGPPGTEVPLYYIGTYQLDNDTFTGHVFCTEPFHREQTFPVPPEEEGMGTESRRF